MANHTAYSVVGSTMPAHHGGRQSSNGGGGSPHVRGSNAGMYSPKQLSDALLAGLGAVKEQLGVLAILDGTATNWPGLNRSFEDLEFVVAACVKTTTTLDKERDDYSAQLADALQQNEGLQNSLTDATSGRDESAKELKSLTKKERKARDAEAAALAELAGIKQDLWTAENGRSDLANQNDRLQRAADEHERQLNDLRATTGSQGHSITNLSSELAGRKADVVQLTKLSNEQRQHIDHLKTQLDRTEIQLEDTAAALVAMRNEKTHYEKEAHRLSEEAGRLGVDLDKAIKEIQRLKDWMEVVKKLDTEKAQEAALVAATAKGVQDKRRAQMEGMLQAARVELNNREEHLRTKDAELANAAKQMSLLNLNIKECQKHVATANLERAAVGRQRDDARAAGVKQQSQLHVLNTRLQEREKAMIASDGAAQVMLISDRAMLTSKLDAAVKDGAVHKALAEGWQRDIHSIRGQLSQARGQCAVLQATLDKFTKDVEGSKVDAIKANVVLEQQLAAAQALVTAKEGDMKKVQFEGQSAVKALQQTVQRLQRENEAAADEVMRLRHGDVAFVRLPALNKRPGSMHDDLANLRRVLVNNAYNQNSPPPELQSRPGASLPNLLPHNRNQTR